MWFVGAILLSIAEVVGGEFVLLMLGGGALAAASSALICPDQLVAPADRLRHGVRRVWWSASDPRSSGSISPRAAIKTGMDAIIGSKAMVISTVDGDTAAR